MAGGGCLRRASVVIGWAIFLWSGLGVAGLALYWWTGPAPPFAAVAPYLALATGGAALIWAPRLPGWAASGALWRALAGLGVFALVALPLARPAARPALAAVVAAGAVGGVLAWRAHRRALRVIVAPYPPSPDWDAWLHALPSGQEAGRAAEWWVNNRLDAALPRAEGYVVLHNVDLGRAGDIDAVVIGPTGLWVVEAKLWSGTHELTHDGRWERVPHFRDFHDPHDQLATLLALLRDYVAARAPELAGVAGAVPQGLLVWAHPYSTVRAARGRRHWPVLRLEAAIRRIRRRWGGRHLTHAQIARLAAILTPTARAIGDN
jgi:hypothetical protein